MSSGFLLFLFLMLMLVALALADIGVYREGRETLSQWVIKQAKSGNGFWMYYSFLFPIFIALVGIWLIFHWEGLCINFGWFCEVDI